MGKQGAEVVQKLWRDVEGVEDWQFQRCSERPLARL